MENLQKFFKNKRVLITGHTGFKGSWLTQLLLNWRADVAGIALKPNTNPDLFTILNIKEKIKNYFCDIRNFKKVKEIILEEKPEIIFHLAAQPLVRDSYDDPLYTFETNIIGTANVLESIRQSGKTKSAVIITTDKVYEEGGEIFYKETDKLGGHDPYSGSKAGAEMVVNSYIKSFLNPEDYQKLHQTLIASARSGNVIGGGDWQKDRIIPDAIRAVFEKKQKLIIRNPKAVRPWQYVLEPLYGYLLLSKKLYEGKGEFSGAWNFGPEKDNYITVETLIKKIFNIFKGGAYEIKKDLRRHENQYLGLNINKAKRFLGWTPVYNFDQTLKLTLDWYKSFYGKKNIVKITNQQIKSFLEKIK